MKKLLLILTVCYCFQTYAEKKVALLIGINTYSAFKSDNSRPAPPDLYGCVNDVMAVSEVLKSKFGFAAKDIRLLTDKDATRNAILDAFDKILNDKTIGKGDVVFMYYSGHGSQVVNSLGGEDDKMDETIVPVDAGAGMPD